LIEGTVVDTRQQPVALIEVVLIPDTQRNRPDLYRRVTADINGRFTIRGIPPGNYRLYAWEEIEPYAYFDPEVVQQVESQGKAVRVTELSKETVEIRSIP
jgi:carboxypeptidase family protein